MIKILHTSKTEFNTSWQGILSRGADDLEDVLKIVNDLLKDIKINKEKALLSHIARFDGWNPKDMDEIMISPAMCKKSYQSLPKNEAKALNTAYRRIFSFHQKQKEKSWLVFEKNQSIIGQKYTPIERVGLYIPGGKAAYPSSLLMNAIPAIVAGVDSIAVCTPTPENKPNHLLLAALHICGINEIYKVGGASAIGFMAYGTRDIPKVDFISGPGNIFVACAKKAVFGEVGVDMIAGPSEIAIIADESANITYLAYDLLSQAEHDEMASSFLFATSNVIAESVAKKIEEILPMLLRKDIARKSIDNRGAIVVCKDIEECVRLCNKLAPEHLEILTQSPFLILPKIRHAGAIFLGEYTPEPIGDYLAGPNHTLPTGSTARFFSPLGVENFMKRSSIISFSKQAINELGQECALLAHLEHLSAHQQSVLARLKTNNKNSQTSKTLKRPKYAQQYSQKTDKTRI